MSFKTSLISLLSVVALAVAATAQADWTLDNDNSSLNFVSTKAGKVAEVHSFGTLSGKVDKNGYAEIAIDLASVNTNIEIRDERMREYLFETDRFALAVITAQLDTRTLSGLEAGTSATMSIEGELTLHGKSQPVTLPISAYRLDDNTMLVISSQPFVINADSFELAAGVEKLREIAGLPSISTAVPVSFRLSFTR